MSKLVAFAGVQGGYKVVSQAEGAFNKALASHNADTKIGFPNTAYYLPVIYSLTGMKVGEHSIGTSLSSPTKLFETLFL